MDAPTVSRPLPKPMNEMKNEGFITMASAVLWVRRVVIILAILGSLALAAVLNANWNEGKRLGRVRQQWDDVYKALKDKVKPDDRIVAFEGIAEKLIGSPAHAYVLMELGHLYLEKSQKPEKEKSERDAALKKSIDLYVVVASHEPYKSNPSFGPIAAENAALAMEQAENYDGAIDLLNTTLDSPQMREHFLYNKMVAQLGRVYWLRSLKKTTDGIDAKVDREAAKSRLAEVIRPSNTMVDQPEWYDQSEYIKSLLDGFGKALPDGKAPPEKQKPAVPKPVE